MSGASWKMKARLARSTAARGRSPSAGMTGFTPKSGRSAVVVRAEELSTGASGTGVSATTSVAGAAGVSVSVVVPAGGGAAQAATTIRARVIRPMMNAKL